MRIRERQRRRRRPDRASLAASENREARVLQARAQETLARPALPDIAVDAEHWLAPQKERSWSAARLTGDPDVERIDATHSSFDVAFRREDEYISLAAVRAMRGRQLCNQPTKPGAAQR